ncbi:hypothetical protein [Bradyrhizobium lablabi]|uniref:hypothetical protein n=1 Tax=Bradyrhizobium lablabi TaxID=722472 RepID=UPI001BA803AE|nr:hypothetical protein [Bradyrhizobium lablabi]MBR0694008.1 hypothetical protein [Bradyrhizobium lablabi]
MKSVGVLRASLKSSESRCSSTQHSDRRSSIRRIPLLPDALSSLSAVRVEEAVALALTVSSTSGLVASVFYHH